MSKSPERRAWSAMRQRCGNPNNPQYDLYGGRGIKVCARWRESFENFYADMGARPGAKYSLDRIDTNGDYEPGNCRWATPVEQSNNTNANRILVCHGESHSLAEWSRITGISNSGLRWRLANGWTVEDALSVRPSYGNGWKATHHATSKAK